MQSPWSLPVNIIYDTLSVQIDRGLTIQEVEVRLKEYGPNSFGVQTKKTRWALLKKQLNNPVVYVLIFASLIALALGEFLDAWAIIAIVILNIVVGFIQEIKAEASIEALASLTAPKAKVLRGGTVSEVRSEEVVPGDILVLEAGDYVPADARIFMAHQLSVQESVLTGESLPVSKRIAEVPSDAALGDRKNMLFAGTAISTGTCKAIVVSTGKSTEIGKIAQMMVEVESPDTPMQIRLEAVSRKLLGIGILVILLMICIGIFRGLPWLEILMSALSLSIAAIPEGLPTVVTIALVLAIRRMSKKRALVRKMDSVETLGATDVICTDKTGTLTTGKMQVREFYLISSEVSHLFYLNMVLCNNASIQNSPVGDTTEIALLEFAKKSGHDEQIRKEHLRLHEWSFDSERKRMSVACEIDGEVYLLTKGAPESILPLCQLLDQNLFDINMRMNDLAGKGMRVLAFAARKFDEKKFQDFSEQDVEKDLTFLGLTAMADPPRAEALEAIKKCQNSGIRVIMITGDHPQTAGAIAFELGITKSLNDRVLSGKELAQFQEKALRECVKDVSVYARVSPEHKLKLVTALKSLGHIVAMTGDGVNDAPALKVASIGVSMGKGGTEVARQASSMILTDDNFATIVDAVEEGRAVNGNIKRTLQYLLSTNLAELLFILAATLLGWPIPLLPVNLLWLNLVTDGLPSLALASEVVPPKYLEGSVRPSQKTFFDRNFYTEMIIVGILVTIMSLIVYYYGLKNFDVVTARTLAFSFLVYAVLFRSFSCRSDKMTFFEMRPNVYHLTSVIIPIILQIFIQRNELFATVFNVKALSIQENILLLMLSCVPVTLVEMLKIVRRFK